MKQEIKFLLDKERNELLEKQQTEEERRVVEDNALKEILMKQRDHIDSLTKSNLFPIYDF